MIINRMNMKKIFIILLVITALPTLNAQVAVVNSAVMPYNITPESLIAASLNNTQMEQQVSLVAKLYNLNGDLLMVVRSAVFSVKPGFNIGYEGKRRVESVEYIPGNQTSYIKTSHTLPSGVFKICLEVINTNGNEPNEYCDEIQSDFNQYLYLVYPSDKEVIPTITPMLSWSHSEPFNILSSGEFFRMTVAEIKNNQSPEEAISLNSPVMLKDYVNTHNLQYPYEAKALVKGKRYAWQVTKIGNGAVLNKTETWEFKIAGADPKIEANYAALRKELDGSFYKPENNKLFFKFDEEYAEGVVSCIIYNDKKEPVQAKATNQSERKNTPNYKRQGSNEYAIDLDDYNIEKGFYTLEVRNSKNELFILKFYID
jgi:hypothetical protein